MRGMSQTATRSTQEENGVPSGMKKRKAVPNAEEVLTLLFESLFIGEGNMPWSAGLWGVEGLISLLENIEKDYRDLFSWGPCAVSSPLLDVDADGDAPIRALANTVVAAQNAVLERVLALQGPGFAETPTAAAKYLPPHVVGVSDPKVQQAFSPFLQIDNYAPRADAPYDNVIDVRDYGVGIAPSRLLDAIAAGHPYGNDVRPWLIPTTDLGRRSWQFAAMTLVATRKQGSDEVAYTVIQPRAGTRVHEALLIEKRLPTTRVPESMFAAGTLVRHVGYQANLYNAFKERSVRGALDRSLPRLLFPVTVFHHDMAKGGRAAGKGAVGSLQRLDHEIKNPAAAEVNHAATKTKFSPSSAHSGDVTITAYQLDPKDNPHDAVRSYTRPTHPVLFTLHGQTIISESLKAKRARTTMGPVVVSVACDALDRTSRLELLKQDSALRSEIVGRVVELVSGLGAVSRPPRPTKDKETKKTSTRGGSSSTAASTQTQLAEVVAKAPAVVVVAPPSVAETPGPRRRIIPPPVVERPIVPVRKRTPEAIPVNVPLSVARVEKRVVPTAEVQTPVAPPVATPAPAPAPSKDEVKFIPGKKKRSGVQEALLAEQLAKLNELFPGNSGNGEIDALGEKLRAAIASRLKS